MMKSGVPRGRVANQIDRVATHEREFTNQALQLGEAAEAEAKSEIDRL